MEPSSDEPNVGKGDDADRSAPVSFSPGFTDPGRSELGSAAAAVFARLRYFGFTLAVMLEERLDY